MYVVFQILHRKVLAVIFFSKNEKSNIKNLNQDKMCISQVKPRPNTHDSIDYHARLNTNYHASIIDYYQLLCNLVMFKFYRIVDDSFFRLNERMIVNDSFFGPQFCQNFAECFRSSFSASLSRLQYLQLATFLLKFQMPPQRAPCLFIITRSHGLILSTMINYHYTDDCKNDS